MTEPDDLAGEPLEDVRDDGDDGRDDDVFDRSPGMSGFLGSALARQWDPTAHFKQALGVTGADVMRNSFASNTLFFGANQALRQARNATMETITGRGTVLDAVRGPGVDAITAATEQRLGTLTGLAKTSQAEQALRNATQAIPSRAADLPGSPVLETLRQAQPAITGVDAIGRLGGRPAELSAVAGVLGRFEPKAAMPTDMAVTQARQALLGTASARPAALESMASLEIAPVRQARESVLGSITGIARVVPELSGNWVSTGMGDLVGMRGRALLGDALVRPSVSEQLGLSGVGVMLGRALGTEPFISHLRILSNLASPLHQGLQHSADVAAERSLALYAEAMQAQQDAALGEEEKVAAFADRWMRRSKNIWFAFDPGEPSAFATALLEIDMTTYSPDNAFSLLVALAAGARAARSGQRSVFERQTGDQRVESLQAQGEILELPWEELTTSGQNVENEAIEGFGGFTDPRMIALLSVLKPDDAAMLMARSRCEDWKQAAEDCGRSPEDGARARDRVRYRANRIQDAFAARPALDLGKGVQR